MGTDWRKPMLCKPATEVPTGDDWVLECKLDGWRLISHVRSEGVDLYAGRNASDRSGQAPTIEQELAEAVPSGTVLDGELVDPRAITDRASAVSTGLATRDPHLLYVVFDVLLVDGEDVRALAWADRHERLAQLDLASTHVRVNPHGPASVELHRSFVESGLEGSVAKRVDARYLSGRRTDSCVKIKPSMSADALIIGVKPGEGQHNRSEAGAFLVRLPNGAETSTKVQTDRLIAQVTANPERYIGRTVELAHYGVTEDGKLRSPIFKRFRDDA